LHFCSKKSPEFERKIKEKKVDKTNKKSFSPDMQMREILPSFPLFIPQTSQENEEHFFILRKVFFM
jgi:hypothetical protein